jgi:hypothetical protein
VLVGRSLDVAIALRTTDGGRSWVSFKTEAASATGWGVGDDGTMVFAVAKRGKGAVVGKPGPIESVKLYFAAPGDTDPTGPVAIFPNEGPVKASAVPMEVPRPVVLSSKLAALVVSVGGRKQGIAYGARAGESAPPTAAWATAEEVVPTPYGRPASMLTVQGGTVQVRPWPKPDEPSTPGSAIPGLRATAATARQLAEGPSCEAGPWSFHRITQPPGAVLVGVSPSRAFASPLPAVDATLIGCSADAVILRVVDAKSDAPVLVRCTVEGQCTTPKSPPFRVWPEKHDRTLQAVSTSQGAVALLGARAGARWGLYLGQSLDGGALYELPRVVGEGSTERGVLELGAVIGWPSRVLLLLSADVTGTTRRGWYALASDDGGSNWGPP